MHFISHPRDSDQSPNLLTGLAQHAQIMVARSALHGLHVRYMDQSTVFRPSYKPRITGVLDPIRFLIGPATDDGNVPTWPS